MGRIGLRHGVGRGGTRRDAGQVGGGGVGVSLRLLGAIGGELTLGNLVVGQQTRWVQVGHGLATARSRGQRQDNGKVHQRTRVMFRHTKNPDSMRR